MLGARRISSLPIRIVLGPEGLTTQRNTGVRAIVDAADVVVFFDDDFLPSRHWLQRLEMILIQHPPVLGVMGNTLADGASGDAIDLADAEQLICDYDRDNAAASDVVEPIQKLYGCNMAYRALLFGSVQFDERLPLHGWLEDRDFSARVRTLGPIVSCRDLWGVHLGLKIGKTSDVRVGVSQIVNPVYLYFKGSLRLGDASRLLMRPLLKNIMRVFSPEPYIDRRRRLWGNMLGFAHLLSGRVDPARILEVKN